MPKGIGYGGGSHRKKGKKHGKHKMSAKDRLKEMRRRGQTKRE